MLNLVGSMPKATTVKGFGFGKKKKGGCGPDKTSFPTFGKTVLGTGFT